MDTEKALVKIVREFNKATKKFGAFNTHHEGYAVILEELDELWDEVKKKSRLRDYDCLEREAVQVGAMALRFLVDLIPDKKNKGKKWVE